MCCGSVFEHHFWSYWVCLIWNSTMDLKVLLKYSMCIKPVQYFMSCTNVSNWIHKNKRRKKLMNKGNSVQNKRELNTIWQTKVCEICACFSWSGFFKTAAVVASVFQQQGVRLWWVPGQKEHGRMRRTWNKNEGLVIRRRGGTGRRSCWTEEMKH